MASDLWATPQDLFDILHAEFSFTTDVCALPENAKCNQFFTPEMNGLDQVWRNVCWMNPPYGRTIGLWMKKAYESARDGATVVALIPNRSNAPWWHEWVMKAREIRFVKHKVPFTGRVVGVPFWGSVIVVFDQGCPYHSPSLSSFIQPRHAATPVTGGSDE